MSMMLAPVTLPNNTDVIQLGGPDSISAIRIADESAFHLSVAMNGNGGTYPIDAWTADVIYTKDFPGWDGSITITSLTILTNNAGAPATSALITIFGKQEQVKGTYPVGLSRLNNIGNAVNTNVTSTNSIDNEGNPAPTQIITSIVSGDGTNKAVSLTNDGVFSIGTAAHPGSISFDNGKITSDGAGQLNLANGILNLAGNDILDASGVNTSLISTSGHNIQFQIPKGNVLATIDSTGINSLGIGVNFNIGRIKDINNGSALSGTINHGLSGTPAAVVDTCNSSSSSATVGASNYTTTQFTLTIGGGLNGRWVAYR